MRIHEAVLSCLNICKAKISKVIQRCIKYERLRAAGQLKISEDV